MPSATFRTEVTFEVWATVAIGNRIRRAGTRLPRLIAEDLSLFSVTLFGRNWPPEPRQQDRSPRDSFSRVRALRARTPRRGDATPGRPADSPGATGPPRATARPTPTPRRDRRAPRPRPSGRKRPARSPGGAGC